jgi:hypothetical protein
LRLRRAMPLVANGMEAWIEARDFFIAPLELPPLTPRATKIALRDFLHRCGLERVVTASEVKPRRAIGGTRSPESESVKPCYRPRRSSALQTTGGA